MVWLLKCLLCGCLDLPALVLRGPSPGGWCRQSGVPRQHCCTAGGPAVQRGSTERFVSIGDGSTVLLGSCSTGSMTSGGVGGASDPHGTNQRVSGQETACAEAIQVPPV
jgi:hypothetical protein